MGRMSSGSNGLRAALALARAGVGARRRGGDRAARGGAGGARGAARRVVAAPGAACAALGVVLVLRLVVRRAVPGGVLPSKDNGDSALHVEPPDDASRQRA